MVCSVSSNGSIRPIIPTAFRGCASSPGITIANQEDLTDELINVYGLFVIVDA
jgi:hypothetical protein